jgi:aspartate carbamoyltransferase catalytic subunit
MPLQGQSFLEIEPLTPQDIQLILDTSESLKEIYGREIKKVPTLRGKTIINLFYEPSTRTRTSFEIAGKRMSADVINISTSSSSVLKGEGLKDTAKNLAAMKPDIIVVRHPAPGAPHLLAKILDCSIINAGDGAHEHPTQAMLDLLTIREKKGRIAGLHVAIVGDISHSRVARSNIWALTKMGANVTLVGPKTLIPVEAEQLGVSISYCLDDIIPRADVLIILRIQSERHQHGFFPTLREYAKLFGLNLQKLSTAKPDVLIMHPGPINRGIEIDPEVADGPYSVILDQVTNGLAVRMALMYLLLGGVEV